MDEQQALDNLRQILARPDFTRRPPQYVWEEWIQAVEDWIYNQVAGALRTIVEAASGREGGVGIVLLVAAVVVLEPGARLDLDEVRRHFAASGLAKQKTPERLVIVESLPRTSLGKVRKADLRATHFGR